MPKGGWENDETVEEGVQRETYEEAGIYGTLGEVRRGAVGGEGRGTCILCFLKLLQSIKKIYIILTHLRRSAAPDPHDVRDEEVQAEEGQQQWRWSGWAYRRRGQ